MTEQTCIIYTDPRKRNINRYRNKVRIITRRTWKAFCALPVYRRSRPEKCALAEKRGDSKFLKPPGVTKAQFQKVPYYLYVRSRGRSLRAHKASLPLLNFLYLLAEELIPIHCCAWWLQCVRYQKGNIPANICS